MKVQNKKGWGKWRRRMPVVGALLVLVFFAVSTVWAFYSPPSFLRVHEVVVMTRLKHLTDFDLIRLSGVKKGDSILGLSLASVRDNLLRYPWIKEVRLSKRIPARILIWVEEQEPVALVELPDETAGSSGESSWYFVNRQGRIFKKVEKKDSKDLPIFTGLVPEEMNERLPQMLTLISSVEDSNLVSSLGISEIHWGAKEGLALFTKEPCIKLELGGLDEKGSAEVWTERLRRFSEAWGTIRTTATNPKVVDLSMERRVIVKQGL